MSLTFTVGDLTIHRIIEQETTFLPALDLMPALTPDLLAQNRQWMRAAGAIDADIDPEVAAETLGALTEQLAYVKLGLAEETPSDAEIERLGAHSARIWYRGVFGHQRQTSP